MNSVAIVQQNTILKDPAKQSAVFLGLGVRTPCCGASPLQQQQHSTT